VLFILTGPIHSGKTSLLKNVATGLYNQGISVDGFLCISIWEHDLVSGYDLQFIKTAQKVPFIRRTGERDWDRIGPFFFIPQTLQKAHEIILQGKEADILLVDEVGPLELQGKGLWPALQQILSHRQVNILLVVRSAMLEAVLKAVAGDRDDIRIFNVMDNDLLTELLNVLPKSSK